ncbi:TrbG/VirB9 family P-type conjugative transfer protein [Caulobacter segnis]|uniref:TrbG/VirB9 family P-type conjugative transfer protein n=1 Tax=Caulobacter segnis TaxID=88688 RepID=UPI001CBEDC60|nr:TrbG/VirB9 family P-type conjugative transfer protein [Caulobacter segnis]UAL08872.1 TrbG/VirB9 family P-type conjugative transfer protein [Caulobacter segnis]
MTRAYPRTLLAVLALTSIGATALAGPVLAADTPRPGAIDSRIRTVAYDPDQVVRLTGYFGIQTMLEFAPDERIENVSIGDALGWQVTPNKKANLLFLKPLDRTAATNMTVVTDRRRYVLELVVAGPKASSKDLAYVVRFLVPAPAPMVVTTAPPPGAPVVRNSAYAVKGDAAIQPTKVFDDGAATYFAWPAQADLPAVFVVGADGVEGLANAVVRDGYLVVDQLAPRFVLRSGKASLTVVNGAFSAHQEAAR